MKKCSLLIIIFLFSFISNIYAFSFNEFTAKLDVDRANRLMKKGDYDGAVTLYEKALSKVPNSPEIFYNMGTTMSSIGDMNSAVQLFDMAKKSFTDNTSKEMKSSVYYNAGLTRIEMKDYQGAINELVESLVNTPNDNNSKRALEYAQKRLEEQKQNNNTGPSSQQNQDQDGQSDNNNSGSGNNDQNNQDNQNNDNQGDQNSNNQNNQDNQNNDNQQNQNNQNSGGNNDNQNNNGGDNNQDNQNNNGGNNNQNDNQDSKSDIDRLLESLRQYRKDKDNGDQYYGGGRIDKDW
ncbi:tetratricopeptide repeat protein [Brachyspira hampsonii]|uniref:Putative aerotolerance-related exported protein BatC containing TPR domain n=1 Tax=Brachyspira hampsonii 30446 TaxID=1289135 RepID=A0A2U4EVP3_9SPIR|nr:tetratricopeptide repeat protein [Brachyspira hampsonii]EKV56978.1 putative aerotolerance-related exported protein BatC containing TPR domain [Brachyspira hampsonii 30446]MBW5390007.1 tetratricopeptide repeat protein [Brachyspira hampsonii]MBW5393519.1 tetratricopeptide repeat protein [Brachyspira hampsonii]OEJ20392.1 aerotolerance protein [Brachyspira hampsonii]